jgi:hypothetical protein
MNKHTFDDFIGKEVILYPQDTYTKRAILLEVNQYGYLFEITFSASPNEYKVGEINFINHSMKMVMSMYKPLN